MNAIIDTGIDTPTNVFDTSRPNRGRPAGVSERPRIRTRTSIGWTDETFSVTGIVNYRGHYFHRERFPSSRVITACGCPSYSNLLPNFITTDLALGYNTGLMPSNSYLQNVGINLVIGNVMDKHAPFVYRGGEGESGAMDIEGADPIGRTISLTVNKQW